MQHMVKRQELNFYTYLKRTGSFRIQKFNFISLAVMFILVMLI